MSKPRAPTPPDPVATANAQTTSNINTANANATLNNVNQNTPWGSVNFTSQPGPGGVSQWTQNTTLSPNQQTLNDITEQNSIGLGNLAGDQLNTVSGILGTNYNPRRFDTGAATGGPLDIAGALGDYGGDVEARTRELATRGLGAEFDRSEESLRSRLANQGVNAGTDAFKTELEGFNESKGNAFANAELMARGQAQSDRGQMLSELLGQRGTNLGEAQQQYGYDTTADQAQRTNPLNEIIGLMNGMQINPINPGQPNQYNVNGTDVAGINQNNFANQMAAYQQQMASRNGLLGGLASLGGAAIGASDARLKRDTHYLSTDERGNRWWLFRYLWDALDAPLRLGVMAQEVLAHNPRAVLTHPSGFLLVDYARL
jgi:hypothetical protein